MHSLLFFLLTVVASAQDIYVDPTSGDDRSNGLAAQPSGMNGPVKTIARGIKLAGPGDAVHLAKAVYRESVIFHNRSGEPGKPITLDGHEATIEGSDPLNPADWQQISPGLYRNDKLVRPDLLTRDTAVSGRWFFLFDGRPDHAGRTSKGPSRPLKKPADLHPGQWTIVNEEHAFYICIDAAKTLADYKTAAPVRSSAIVLSGECRHIVVRNITGTHVHNDGYNIHGVTRDAVFENIRAVECGDDGFSAHDDCAVRVDGFESIGNSTGICNTGNSTSENNRVLIRDCLGFDVFVLDTNSHKLTNSLILSSAARTVTVDGSRGGGTCTLELDNVLIHRVAGPNEVRVTKGSVFEARHTAFVGLHLQATGGSVSLYDSVIAGEPSAQLTLWPEVRYKAGRNVFDLRSLRWNKTYYSRQNFADFQRITGQDQGSIWQPVRIEHDAPQGLQEGIGFDPFKLPQ